jgi:hypothetical protein
MRLHQSDRPVLGGDALVGRLIKTLEREPADIVP